MTFQGSEDITLTIILNQILAVLAWTITRRQLNRGEGKRHCNLTIRSKLSNQWLVQVTKWVRMMTLTDSWALTKYKTSTKTRNFGSWAQIKLSKSLKTIHVTKVQVPLFGPFRLKTCSSQPNQRRKALVNRRDLTAGKIQELTPLKIQRWSQNLGRRSLWDRVVAARCSWISTLRLTTFHWWRLRAFKSNKKPAVEVFGSRTQIVSEGQDLLKSNIRRSFNLLTRSTPKKKPHSWLEDSKTGFKNSKNRWNKTLCWSKTPKSALETSLLTLMKPRKTRMFQIPPV